MYWSLSFIPMGYQGILAYMHAQSLSCDQLLATPWTVARQAPLSMGLSREESWSGLPSEVAINEPTIMSPRAHVPQQEKPTHHDWRVTPLL